LKKFLRKICYLLIFHLFIKRKLSKTITEKVKGFTFKVYPTVFNPTDFISSEIFADFIIRSGNLKGRKILDMGCGSGIVSVFCASSGAKCLAADINPEAVKAAGENAALNGFEKDVIVIESNLFENIKDRFDIIFFNPPYYPKEPVGNFERAFFAGEDYRVLKEFAACSKSHLNNGGIVYMIISSDMDLNVVKSIFSANGLVFEVIEEHKKLFETFYITKTLV